MVRVVGLFLLGLGITLLIPSGIALAYAEGLGQVVGFLACTALVPVPMIVGGIAIIRTVEGDGNQLPEGSELEPDAVTEDTGDPVGGTLAQVRRFELNRLNWIGWLLLLATFGFVVGEAFLLSHILGDGFWRGRLAGRLIGLGALFVAIGFFAGLRWVLRVLGVSIYRW